MINVAAVVPAAGSARRMGAAGDKLYLDLGGRPVLAHTLRALQAAGDLGIQRIIVAVAPGTTDRFEERIRPHLLPEPPEVAVVEGGSSRQESVRRGLDAAGGASWVLVHDGARPLVSRAVLARCIQSARAGRCAVAGLALKDTVKEVDEQGRIVATPRPEPPLGGPDAPGVPRDTLVQAHRQAARDGFDGTDDAVLVERLGMDVHVVMGDETNLKITTPHDLRVAAFLLSTGSAER